MGLNIASGFCIGNGGVYAALRCAISCSLW
jgi:hypothetical protein